MNTPFRQPGHHPTCRLALPFFSLLVVLGLAGATCSKRTESQRKAEAQVALCMEYYANKAYPQALKECMTAIEADPDFGEGYNGIGLIYLAQRRYPEAIENFQKALKRSTDEQRLCNARTNLGIAYAAIGRDDEAIETLRTSLSDDLCTSPDTAYVNLCEVYLRKKETRKAIDACKNAIERHRDHCFAHFKLSEAYESLGQTRSAIEEIGLAIKYCPGWSTPYLSRGKARMKLKQFPQACGDFWGAYDIDSEAEDAREAKRYIDRLKCKKKSAEEKNRESETKDPRRKAQPLPFAK